MKIIEKEILSDVSDSRLIKLKLESAGIAEKVKPGQFVIVMVNEQGERIPLTVVEKDSLRGTITLIIQEIGLTTKLLGRLNMGDSLYCLTGPLGCPTEIKKYGKVILAGGGVGIAEIYPVAKVLKQAGNYLTTILGTRTKDLLILETELKNTSDEILIMTDDGSYGKKGFTTAALTEVLANEKYDLVYVVGPIPMMRKVSEITEGFNLKTLVSLNALMVDGTGMCGCCRVSVAGKVKFSCVDGPEFDAHLVDWQELTKRNTIYEEKEKHICRLNSL